MGVFAAVFDADDRVLCVRHTYGSRDWGMPGGRVEPGEDPITAVGREIAEETGVVAKITAFVGVYVAPYRDDVVLLFRGHAEERHAWSPTDEISEWGFFALTALPAPMAPNPKARFDDVRSGLRGLFCTFAAAGERAPDLSLVPGESRHGHAFGSDGL